MQRALIGLAYGLVMILLSAMTPGFSSGPDVFFAIASAPLPLYGIFPLGAPLVWCGLAFLRGSPRRWVFLLAISLHYVAVIAGLMRIFDEAFVSPFGNAWSIIQYFAPTITALAALYVVGQMFLWGSFIRAARPQKPYVIRRSSI